MADERKRWDYVETARISDNRMSKSAIFGLASPATTGKGDVRKDLQNILTWRKISVVQRKGLEENRKFRKSRLLWQLGMSCGR